MTTYETTTDYITAVVAPALKHCEGEYDHEAIAAEMTRFEGDKLVERDDIDFWDVALANEI